MSYILDALQKSEQQKRQQSGECADDMTPLMMPSPAEPAVVVPTLPIGLILASLVVVLLILTSGLLYWLPPAPAESQLQPQRPPEAVQKKTHASVNSESRLGHATAPQKESALPVVSESMASESTVAPPVRPVSVSAVSLAPASITSANTSPPSSQPTRAVAAVDPPAKAVVATPAAQGGAENAQESDATFQRSPEATPVFTPIADQTPPPKVQRRTLPPLTALSKIPDLIITGHIYSQNTSQRSVSMNGRNWYEGEMIVPDVVLDQITETGILLDVDGFPFPVHRSSGWQSIGH